MAISVGDALLKLGLDKTDFDASMRGLDSSVKTSVSTISTQFKNLATQIGLAFGIAAIVKFAKSSVDAFAETEESARTLDNTLKNIGVSDAQISQIEKFVDKLELATFYDDSQIRDALKNLTIKFGDADVAMKILTVSMQASRTTGEDLGTTVQKISLGLLGSTRGLKDYGIQVKDGTTKLEVLDEITKKMTDDTGKFGKGTKGSADLMKVAFDNLKETIGEKLSPVVKGLNVGLGTQIGLLLASSGSANTLADSWRTIGNVLGATLNTIVAGVRLLIDLGNLPDLLFGDWSQKQKAIDNFIADFDLIKKSWAEVGKTSEEKNKEIEKNTKDLFALITEQFGNFSKYLNTGIKDDSAAIAKAAEDAAKAVIDAAEKAQEELTDKLTTYNDTRKDLVSRLTEFVINQTELERDAKLSAIQDEIDARYNQYMEETSLIDSAAGKEISKLQLRLDQMEESKELQRRTDWLAEKNKAAVSAKTEEERTRILKEIQQQKADWQYEKTREGIRKEMDVIRASAEDQKAVAKEQYEYDEGILKTKLKDSQNYYDDLLLQRNAELKAEELLATNSMDNVLKMLGDKKSEWASLGTIIGDAFWSNLLGAIGDVEGMKDIFTSLIGGSHAIPGETTVPGFAEGGIVTRPTMAMIGERGPEAIVPLNQISNDESLRIQKDMLKELRKFNDYFASKRMARDISLGVSGLGQKV